MNHFSILKNLFSLLLYIFFVQVVRADDDNTELIVDLKGKWKFSIGACDEWINKDFNDKSWDDIKVPDSWEDQGFHGYNGYACYRKKIDISNRYKGRLFFLKLGYIDDVDQVFFNGEMVGSTGSFPPNYESAYNAKREYYIPESMVSYDETNVIVVKVYDNHGQGGIVSGKLGLYASKVSMLINIHLQGFWKFNTTDDLSFKNLGYNDKEWKEILVPLKWENQGYRNYDGFAWYRKEFRYRENINDDRLFLLLGKIDDIDQVYLNGELIGETGDFSNIDESRGGRYYEALRGYLFDKDLLRRRVNVIAVRVYDWGGGGGIYEGPVGIISQSEYIEYWKKIGRKR